MSSAQREGSIAASIWLKFVAFCSSSHRGFRWCARPVTIDPTPQKLYPIGLLSALHVDGGGGAAGDVDDTGGGGGGGAAVVDAAGGSRAAPVGAGAAGAEVIAATLRLRARVRDADADVDAHLSKRETNADPLADGLSAPIPGVGVS